MRHKSVGALLSLIVIFAVNQVAAQSGYDPPPPLTPTSHQECDDFQRRLEARARELKKAASDLSEQIYDQCYRSGLSIDDRIRCHDRNQGGNYGEKNGLRLRIVRLASGPPSRISIPVCNISR